MLWGGISYGGLFPKTSPIFVDGWLESIRPQGLHCYKKNYFTGERYAAFIQSIVAEKAAEEFSDLQEIIFHDDRDRKQRTQMASEAVNDVFVNRIEPKGCAAKLADCWPIGNVWDILEEKLRGREYNSVEQLKRDIRTEWNQFSVSLCRRMIDKIPRRLKLVIDHNGNQIQEH